MGIRLSINIGIDSVRPDDGGDHYQLVEFQD